MFATVRFKSLTLLPLWFLFNLHQATSAQSNTISGICESAALVAASESDVPIDVLRAISLAETGRTLNGEYVPWPWAVNFKGDGRWFPDQSTALRHIQRRLDVGERNFDVGCFQINYRWHGEYFGSIDEMLDPMSNARYAAKFLSTLYREKNDWTLAAGAFHSRTPQIAVRYAERFDDLRAGLIGLVPLRIVSRQMKANRIGEEAEKKSWRDGQMRDGVAPAAHGRFIIVEASSIVSTVSGSLIKALP